MCPLRFVAVIAINIAAAAAVNAQPNQELPGAVLTLLSHRSGHNLLYKSHPEGRNPQPIFGGPILDIPSLDDSYKLMREPHWTRQSPDGRYFASWVYEKGEPYSAYQGDLRPMLWVGDLEGKWTRIVNPDCHEKFAWSPDSKRLAFSILSTHNYRGSLQHRPETTEIVVSGIDGSNTVRVLEVPGKWFVLDWSPDGDYLLVVNRKQGKKLEDGVNSLFEFRLSDAIDSRDRSQQYDPEWNVTHAPDFLTAIDLKLGELQFSDARYSPTRSELALLTFNPRNMYAPNLLADDEMSRGRMMRLLGMVYVLDTGRSEIRKVADYNDGIRGPICWSPDGNEILFSRYLPKDDDREKMSEDKEHGLSIWAVGRDGDNARFVATGWSPDFPRAVAITAK